MIWRCGRAEIGVRHLVTLGAIRQPPAHPLHHTSDADRHLRLRAITGTPALMRLCFRAVRRKKPILAIAWGAACAAFTAAAVQAADSAPQMPTVADLPAVLAAVRAPGAKAVLVNVWATWCDPCREELPVIARFYRQHRAQGLRLVLVSADDEDSGAEIARVLAAAGMPGDTPSFIKHGDDMKFIDGLDRRWTGALPASFLFDGGGHERHWWGAPVTAYELQIGVAGLLPAAPSSSTNPKSDEKRQRP
jgi:thiol-disulfide isomerase/thioredoxin